MIETLPEIKDRSTTKPTFFKKAVRFGASAGLFVSPAFSPIDSQEQSVLTLLSGDGSKNRLNILLLDYNNNLQLIQETTEDLFLITPTNEFGDRVNVYRKLPSEDLKCDQVRKCDWEAVRREIDRTVATGIIPHETMVVVKSNGLYTNGGGDMPSRSAPPDIYTKCSIVRPLNPPKEVRLFFASVMAHECWGHAFAGFDHEGGDLMSNLGAGFFNDQHTQFLRAMKPLIPRNYSFYSKNEINPLVAGTLSADGVFQSQKMSFSARILTVGITQFYSEFVPYHNDGPAIFDIKGPEQAIAWADTGRRIPAPPEWYGLLPDMTYTWRVCSSNLAVPLEKGDPRWEDTIEGWPGIFFPNSCDIKQFHTPERRSDKITPKTLADGQEINNLTPTLVWDNGDPDVFYYEVQVSKDPKFSQEPSSPPLYWELRHGGLTNPQNSYKIPENFSLEAGSTYYWRVRPRIQGDGTPVEWSSIGSFKTSQDARKLAADELEVIRQPDKQVKNLVSREEFLKQLNNIKKEEQELNKSRDEHWDFVEKEVLTKTRIPVFEENGRIIWLDYSENIPFATYLKEEESTEAA